MRLRLCSCAFAFALVCLDFAGVASAHSVVVDPSGGGDFVTLQAALNSIAASFAPETVIVRAGAYAESPTLPQRDSQSLLVCPAGAESTSVDALLLGPSTYGTGSTHRDWLVRGLAVTASVNSVPQKARVRFEKCAFAGGLTVNWLEGGVSMPVADCDFGAPTRLLGIYGVAQSLRFRSAPLLTEPRVGGLYYTDCTFVGVPGETLVVAPRTEDLGFARCTFDSAAIGMHAPRGGFANFTIDRCRFSNLGAAIQEPAQSVLPAWSGPRTVTVRDGRFTNCGRALDWPGGQLVMSADTLAACGDGAITASVDFAVLERLQITATAGIAIDLEVRHYFQPYGSVTVRDSRIGGATGAGLRLRKFTELFESFAFVSRNRIEGCGSGAEVAATALHASGNVLFANAGEGFAFRSLSNGYADSLSDNTAASNGSHGFVFRTSEAALPAHLAVARNVSAGNSGSGFRYEAAFPGPHERNDAWLNQGQAFAGIVPSSSELQADPRFCDLANGDLAVSGDSPCAPAAPTGPMGALGVGCSLPTAGVSPGSALAAFAVHPNPAIGAVEFALPAGVTAGRLDVLDLQGRIVWSRDVTPGVRSVRWEGGAAAPGLYWGRLTTFGRTESRALVRLR